MTLYQWKETSIFKYKLRMDDAYKRLVVSVLHCALHVQSTQVLVSLLGLQTQ